MENKFNYYVRT